MSKILVVEDNQCIRQLLHVFFTEAGFAVFDACDGSEGFTMAKAEKPDVIITDLEMPVLDGRALIHQLRCEPEIADTPVLLFTGRGDLSPEETGKIGANKTFYKPGDFHNLVNEVREMLPH